MDLSAINPILLIAALGTVSGIRTRHRAAPVFRTARL